ncbi:hypothetical protein ACF0H5_018495 [Mactra antiquata]
MEWAKAEDNSMPFLGLIPKPKSGLVTPLSPMDSPKGSPMPFIDIKSVKPRNSMTNNDNVVTLRKKPKVVLPQTPVAQHGVTAGLPNPTIFGLVETKKQGEKKQFAEVVDEDISPIVCSDDDGDDNFGIQLRKETNIPALHYTEGEVNYTNKDALRCMVQDLQSIKLETGCFINETCDPECSQYIPELHFVSCGALGRGSFGQVDLCYDSKTRKPFVRKIMEKRYLRASEVIAPTTFDHPNITKLFGLILRDNANTGLQSSKMELYLEYGGKSLTKLTVEGKQFSPLQIRNLAKQGLEGLKHMNRYSIIHLDIKPENICVLEVKDSVLLKITDFGSSRLPVDKLEFVGVTPEYMAPEMCKYYLQLQGNFGLDWGLTQNDITGAVDVFAFALVIMYMYKGYHIMVKVITNGQTNYNNMDADRKRSLHLNLMIQMAKDDKEFFVHNLIPDECSLDMRDLLIGMTQHNHTRRVTAKQACDYIEGVEKRSLQHDNSEKKETVDLKTNKQVPQNIPQFTGNAFTSIPGIADDCMESETGPVKNKTMGLLRRKLQPYEKNGKGSKIGSKMSATQEMHQLRHGVASKHLQMPSTPVSDFEKLSLEQSLHKQQSREATARCIPVTQSQIDTSADSFLDIRDASNYTRYSTLDTTSCVNEPKIVPTSIFKDTSVESTACNGRSRVESSALPGNRMVQISAEMLLRLLQKASSGQNTLMREATDVQPPIINLQAEGLGPNRATPRCTSRGQHECTPMEDSPPMPANIPKFDFL